jgi:YHS domain-containing protein
MQSRARILCATAIALLTLAAPAARADDKPHAAAAPHNVGKDRLALQGYDPVAYFDGQPAKGKPELTAEREGVVYRFASPENRARFQQSPAKYAPAYGGWCATAMAQGKKVEVDPKSFKVTDGRLFLFYKSIVHDARQDWTKDESAMRRRADGEWKRLTGE